MDNSLRHEIHNRMNLKETDELLEIWQKNDRAEWSEEAFDVVRDVLKERGVDIPKQGQPVYVHQEVKNNELHDFTDEERRIMDDRNPPAFYDPLDALLTARQIDKIAKVMVGFIAVYSVANFPESFGIVQAYFLRNPNSALMYLVTLLLVAANAGIGMIVAYLPLKALSRVLRILMEMEFNSRKAN